MFPDYGRAFIETLCQYYHLQDGNESSLQNVVELLLNNDLPRDLAYLNKHARTLKELYVWNEMDLRDRSHLEVILKLIKQEYWRVCLVQEN